MAASPLSVSAQNQQPTDVDLRTAYCIPVVKSQIVLLQQALTPLHAQGDFRFVLPQQAADEIQKSIANLESVLKRLQLYFALKLRSVDPLGLALAEKRGEADVQTLSETNGRCAVQNGVPQDSPHYNACMDQDLIARMKACETPTWLPF
jgi:hypothetical protein